MKLENWRLIHEPNFFVFVQSGEIRRVGDNKASNVDTRIITGYP